TGLNLRHDARKGLKGGLEQLTCMEVKEIISIPRGFAQGWLTEGDGGWEQRASFDVSTWHDMPYERPCLTCGF
ncbi:hypothetical protein DENSPDRAFT_842838, partial [Dentipellis sp. KUC8613]